MNTVVRSSDAGALPSRRARTLNEVSRGDHFYLAHTDQCQYLAEYRSGGYRRINQLMSNFKCRPSIAAANAARLRHKRFAIAQVASVLRHSIDRRSVETATWVPIPPSVAIGDPDYDDRLQRTLTAAFSGYDFDLRLLLQQTGSMKADHAAVERLRAEALYAMIGVNIASLSAMPLRERIVLFDDLLTTGKHYKCCERRLREALPQIPICGYFIARRVLAPRWRSLPGRSG